MAASRPRKYIAPNTVLGLDHVVLRVRDLAASVEFYKRVLGARVERQLRTPRIVQLRIGDSLLDLVPGRKGRAATANLDHFAVRVAQLDPEALAMRLLPYGIEAAPPAERYGADGYGPSVYFDDPDGNRIELKGTPTRPRIRR
jgi:glyoxylase I family protein